MYNLVLLEFQCSCYRKAIAQLIGHVIRVKLLKYAFTTYLSEKLCQYTKYT